MRLHLISKSPLSYQALEKALPFIAEDDCIMLIDDGVYTLALEQLPADITNAQHIYVLTEDLTLRGLTSIPDLYTCIGMDEFVNLSFKASNIISWY